MSQQRLKLCELIRRLSYRQGKFLLASGRESHFYVDLKPTTLHPEGAILIIELAWRTLDPILFGGVGGPTMGADPLATALSLTAFTKGFFVPAFIIRKEPKKHGTSQWIEGRDNLIKEKELLIVEDVVTTGGSSLKGIEKVRAEGFQVNRLLAVLDREEGARENLARAGVELVALTTIADIHPASMG